MSIFKNLAKILISDKYMTEEEIEDLLETHFNFYQQDLLTQNLATNDILKRRIEIQQKRRDIELQKNIIERDLLIAKSRLREGEEVDTEWMARANFAFRIKKGQLSSFQQELGNLKFFEKQQFAEKYSKRETKIKGAFLNLVKKQLGEKKATELIEAATKEVDNEIVW